MTVFVFAIAVIAAVGIRATGDPRCAVYIFMGKTDPQAAPHSQQSMILVPADTPGVTVLRPLTVFGYDDAPRGRRPLSEVMSDRTTIALARDAADRVALANRVDRVSQFVVTCDTRGVIVTLGISGQQAQADFPTTECSLR